MLLDDLLGLWRDCSFPERDGLKLISLRGAKVRHGVVVLSPERVDAFDDTLFLFDEAEQLIDHVPCTAGQPGWYWINKYPDGQGAPITRPGCYSYVRGPHKGHEALRQQQTEYGRLAVVRDVNKNGIPDFAANAEDYFDYPLETGINIHACTGTPDHVGVWSSGCHVVQDDWGGADWGKVHHLTYDAYSGQQRFLYAVCDGRWLFDDGCRLLMGSYGPNVVKLAEFLKSKGVANLSGEHFDQQYDQAYRRWQRIGGRMQDGISVNPPWVV